VDEKKVVHPTALAGNRFSMTDPVSTSDPQAVHAAVLEMFRAVSPGSSAQRLDTVFARSRDCFEGRCPGYLPIDARYHDFEHTMQGTLCLARLLGGRHAAGAVPVVNAEMFELAITAALLHDTGYLKLASDREGTGAKYTLTHVHRSAEFAGRMLPALGFSETQIKAIQNMIRCTGVNADLSRIAFQSELERLLGCALATADLLGQMAADDYGDKLPLLFEEFSEAARYNGNTGATGGFTSAADLVARTPGFWENYVQPKIETDFLGLHRFLDHPYPDGPNPYVARIEANLERIRQQLAA
jgi:hypothetical protein